MANYPEAEQLITFFLFIFFFYLLSSMYTEYDRIFAT